MEVCYFWCWILRLTGTLWERQTPADVDTRWHLHLYTNTYKSQITLPAQRHKQTVGYIDYLHVFTLSSFHNASFKGLNINISYPHPPTLSVSQHLSYENKGEQNSADA